MILRFFLSAFLLFSLASYAFAIDKGDDYIDFTLNDPDGNPVQLSSFLGKVVFLDVWASWCLPCAKEMPFLADVYEKYKDQGFVVVAVSVDEKKSNIKRFFRKKMKGKEVTFPVLHDPEKKIRKLYQMDGIPASVIIDRDGKIAFEPRTGFNESHRDEILKQIGEVLVK